MSRTDEGKRQKKGQQINGSDALLGKKNREGKGRRMLVCAVGAVCDSGSLRSLEFYGGSGRGRKRRDLAQRGGTTGTVKIVVTSEPCKGHKVSDEGHIS